MQLILRRSVMLKAFMLFIFISCSELINAQDKVHLIKILDFNELEYVLRANASHVEATMEKEIEVLAKNLNIPESGIISHDLYGPKFTREGILGELRNLQCENDIVVIVYFGHGFKSETNTTEYPDLYIANLDNSINFSDVLGIIKKKKPNFMLSVVSTCQEHYTNFTNPYPPIIPPTQRQIRTYTASPVVYEVRQPQRYQDLFKREEAQNFQTVSIEFLSCSDGEVSYFSDDQVFGGGYFFEEFIKIFHDNLLKPTEKINWTSIAEETYKNTVLASKDEPKGIQHPYCLVDFISKSGESTTKLLTENVLNFKPVNIPADTPIVIDKPKTNSIPPAVYISDYYHPYKGTPSLAYAIRLTKLSNTYREAGHPDYAISAINEALPILQRGDKYFEATAHENLGLAYLDKNDIENAKKHLSIAMKKFDAFGSCGSATTIRRRLLLAPFNMTEVELMITCKEKPFK